jgi:hypothetical protein
VKKRSWWIFRPSPASIICAARPGTCCAPRGQHPRRHGPGGPDAGGHPELARYIFATAVILGDAARVRTELGRDPGLATQADTRTGWTPLHAARASRWRRLDQA